MRRMRVALVLLSLVPSACQCGSDTETDAGGDAAAAHDASPVDTSGGGDSGLHDARVPDTAASDHRTPDTGAGADAARADAGEPVLDCPALPAATGTVVQIAAGDVSGLVDAVSSAATGTTLLLADGTYALDGAQLNFRTDGVTLRSQSGNPEAVTLDGNYLSGELVSITASDVTVAELTLREAYDHPIHVSGRADANITGVRIYRVRVIDAGEQAIKINPSAQLFYADQGRIECSHIELTDDGRSQIRNNCYTGGIDAHAAWGWQVRRNTILGFWCPAGLSEHGVHFWRSGRDTLVEANTIVNCARGIGFGLGDTGTGSDRVYTPDPYPGSGYLGHIDGVIRNNMISASGAIFSSGARFDCGICLEQARGVEVYHNSVATTQNPASSSLEWRWPNTTVTVVNNLLSHNINPRTTVPVTLDGNLESAALALFADVPAGDLHLVPAQAAAAIDQGAALASGLCDEDIDGDARSGARDIGADEIP
ncbi:MAG: hypothetical protein ABIJ09_00005 [Pseudomonadota bacterium]